MTLQYYEAPSNKYFYSHNLHDNDPQETEYQSHYSILPQIQEHFKGLQLIIQVTFWKKNLSTTQAQVQVCVHRFFLWLPR
jgi:hypothetical protein